MGLPREMSQSLEASDVSRTSGVRRTSCRVYRETQAKRKSESSLQKERIRGRMSLKVGCILEE
jgi:hypothetical protein